MDCNALALQLEPWLVETRRWLHSHPELSWEEEQTTARVESELTALGIEIHRLPEKTGLWGVLRGAKNAVEPRTLVLRADMDALPIAEKTSLPYTSKSEGVMHACGHDMHTAMLLGAARILSEHRDAFAGEIRLLFQPAEETSSGAKVCVAQGVMDHADAVFGLHIWGDMDATGMNAAAGPRMASCDNFRVVVHGVSAHGSAPQQGVDAIVAAAAIVLQAQTLVSRNHDPRNPLVVTFGEIHGGKRFNIIADRVELVGTVRTHDAAVRAQVEAELKRVVERTAEAFGATAELTYEHFADAVVNDARLSKVAENAIQELFGADTLVPVLPQMSSEDYSYYLAKAPGVFCFLGGRNPAKGCDAPNHSDHFAVDEDMLWRGAALFARFACDYLKPDA